ncbi:hypothetical protein IQ247_12560 [Plectonema cf. radiosum LEGE 06105]|uniref:Uncharacterized protein n=1 Tax=Plectonema cf. radiosum LEGE 06105 TaxID=945769 RepID=A0A8J7JUJ8_9CYAN|nr:hypothetical protein [Plectonema radiosum]MBE9213490.1 hypothetical protein [Plectonema cf. radiosum LEGE 06105]
MNRKLTLGFILPFLFSTAIPATAQSRLLDKNTALQTVAARILNDSQYRNVQMNCLSFVTVNSNASFFDFIVHEKHGSGCPSASNPKLIFERFRINRNDLRIEQFDKVGNRWIAENKVELKKTNVPIFIGEINKNPQAFNNFMQDNIGKTVYLEIVFGETIPQGYRSQESVPFFEVTETPTKQNSKYHTYFMQQAGNGYNWGKVTNYDEKNRKLSGFFKVGTPKKINDEWTSFDITFVPQ